MVFKDREDAARRMLPALRGIDLALRITVLAIPRGAVVIGSVIATALNAPLDIVGVKKIGAPGNPEYAVGAVDEDGAILGNPDAHAREDYLASEAIRLRALIADRLRMYRGDRPAAELADRAVIIVDDGVATGLTALKAIDFARKRGANRVIMAAPVMAPDAYLRLEEAADEVVSLETPGGFMAVGQYYERFPQVEDAEVIEILGRHKG